MTKERTTPLVREAAAGNASGPAAVDCVGAIPAQVFRAAYHSKNRPVLLQGFARSWPAFGKWSPRYFAGAYGDVDVEVACELNRPPNYGTERYTDRRTMKLRTLVAMIDGEAVPRDVYLVAQNQALDRPEMAAAWDDMALDSAYFDRRAATGRVHLWMGPADTLTPLHYDRQDALLVQVYGRKRVLLIAPQESAKLYNDSGGYSRVDPEQPDFERFPLFRDVRVHTVVIDAGDALFLPFGWWHQVRSLSASISLSISCFAWPGPAAARP